MLKLGAALVWTILSQTAVFAEEISHSQFMIGQTQQGRDIVVERFGTGEERILLVGCIHGTEDIGVRLLNHTMFNVRANPEWLDGKTVYMLSLLNADGLVMNIRGNRDNIDINRQFPSKNPPGRYAEKEKQHKKWNGSKTYWCRLEGFPLIRSHSCFTLGTDWERYSIIFILC